MNNFRMYEPADAPMVDDFLKDKRYGNIQVDRDWIGLELDGEGKLVGLIVAEPVLHVHEFILAPSPMVWTRAKLFLRWALDVACSRGIFEGRFEVYRTNKKMLRFISRTLTARPDTQSVVYSCPTGTPTQISEAIRNIQRGANASR